MGSGDRYDDDDDDGNGNDDDDDDDNDDFDIRQVRVLSSRCNGDMLLVYRCGHIPHEQVL